MVESQGCFCLKGESSQAKGNGIHMGAKSLGFTWQGSWMRRGECGGLNAGKEARLGRHPTSGGWIAKKPQRSQKIGEGSISRLPRLSPPFSTEAQSR